VQGTAEGEPFDRGQLDRMLDLAAKGIAELVADQRSARA
jgi:ribonuclease PH